MRSPPHLVLDRPQKHNDHRGDAHPNKHFHFLCHFLLHPLTLLSAARMQCNPLRICHRKQHFSCTKCSKRVRWKPQCASLLHKFYISYAISFRRLGQGHPVGDWISLILKPPIRTKPSVSCYKPVLVANMHSSRIFGQPLTHRNPLLHRHAVGDKVVNKKVVNAKRRGQITTLGSIRFDAGSRRLSKHLHQLFTNIVHHLPSCASSKSQ